MVYTFGLAKHANIRYRDSMIRLCCCELIAMLRSLSLNCEVISESIGGADFLTFESRPLSQNELAHLFRHSSVVFMAEKIEGFLRPLSFCKDYYLDEDLSEILKYKGKTSSSFLRMMINVAKSLSSFSADRSPLTLLDPVCGKGTACFCAIQAGMNAVGLDIDSKAIHEAADYFTRYLKLNLLKHTTRSFSETIGKASLSVTETVFSDSREHYRTGDTRFLRLATGDTSLVHSICRHLPIHLLIADLPYGIQHAPQYGHRPESFHSLLGRALPAWKSTLLPGGIAAVSFNTLTFPRQQVLDIVKASGLTPFEGDIYDQFQHEVEQAVVRDVVFMMNKSFEGGT